MLESLCWIEKAVLYDLKPRMFSNEQIQMKRMKVWKMLHTIELQIDGWLFHILEEKKAHFTEVRWDILSFPGFGGLQCVGL